MPNIPALINEVTVEFATTVGKDVKQTMIDGLKHCIKKDVAEGHTLNKIYISSANDSHESPSRHAQEKAVDISRINGLYMVNSYSTNDTVKAIVNAIQDTFETFASRRENYGPHFKKKSGAAHTVGGHQDHIHLSVD